VRQRAFDYLAWTGPLFFSDNCRLAAFAMLLSVVGWGASGRVECLPCHSLRINHPGFVGLGIATRSLAFVLYGAARFGNARTQFVQFPRRLRLDSKMLDSVSTWPFCEGEIDARILQRPLSVVRLRYRRCGVKKGGVELNGFIEVLHTQHYMHSFHRVFLVTEGFIAFAPCSRNPGKKDANKLRIAVALAQPAKGDSSAFGAKFHFATALQYLGEAFAGPLHA